MKKGFLKTGQEVEIVGKHEEKLIVKPTGKVIEMQENDEYYEYGGYDRFTNEEIIVDKIYNSILETPTIKEWDEKLTEVIEKTNDAEREIKKISEKLEKYKDLEHAIKMIEGKPPTFYVTDSGVIAYEDFLDGGYRDYNRKRKVISLIPKNDGIQWVWHQYSDGSGTDTNVIPCYSKEEAEKILQKKLDEKFFNKNYKDYSIEGIIRNNPFIKVPKTYIEFYKKTKTDDYDRYIKNKNEEIEKYKEERSKIEKMDNII